MSSNHISKSKKGTGKIHLNNIFLNPILSFQHVINIKNSCDCLPSFFHAKPLKPGMCVTLRACPSSDQPQVDSGCHTGQLWSNVLFYFSSLRDENNYHSRFTNEETETKSCLVTCQSDQQWTVVWSLNRVPFESWFCRFWFPWPLAGCCKSPSLNFLITDVKEKK